MFFIYDMRLLQTRDRVNNDFSNIIQLRLEPKPGSENHSISELGRDHGGSTWSKPPGKGHTAFQEARPEA